MGSVVGAEGLRDRALADAAADVAAARHSGALRGGGVAYESPGTDLVGLL